jgi:hypothetical protein
MKHCPPHATRTAGFASLILRVGERYTLKFASSAACVGLNRGPSQFSLRKTLREPASPSSNNVAVVKKYPLEGRRPCAFRPNGFSQRASDPPSSFSTTIPFRH